MLEQTVVVPTSGAGPSGCLRLSSLLGLLQDAASADADALGIGYDVLIADRRAFLLSHLQIQFSGPFPRWGEPLRLLTWPRGTSGLMALRDFTGTRADGSLFLKATSGWIVVNVDERKPVRPNEVLNHVPTVPDVALHDSPSVRLKPFVDGIKVDERVVRLSDLDPNMHVNNARYADWIIDACHSTTGTGMDAPRGFTINYLREVRLGQRVAILVKRQSASQLIVQGITDRPCFVAVIEL